MKNINKQPPKGKIKFSITLSEEQKLNKHIISSIQFYYVKKYGKTLLASTSK